MRTKERKQYEPTGSGPVGSRRGPGSGRWTAATEGAQHLVQISRDGHLVVEEILQPEIIVPMSQRDQRQEIAESNVDLGRRRLGGRVFLLRRIDAKMRGHTVPP